MAEPTSDLRSRLTALRAEVSARVPRVGESCELASAGLATGRFLSNAYDELLTPVFAKVDWEGAALAAVGGYGRGAVAPRSDLDVRILTRDPAVAERLVERALYPLWDATFAVGHQILLTSEVLDEARDDLATLTSLLDLRYLAGERAMVDELLWRSSGGLFAVSELGRFYARLGEEVSKRHERFGDSVYLLEPDVKNGAGGLRDLDIFRWAAAARYGTGELAGLVRTGALVPREAQEIDAAQDTLWRIRNLLHVHAGRRSDRLTFDEQELIAPLLGYGEGGEAVEQLMSDYYRAARTVTRGLSMILARATPVASQRKPKIEELGGGLRLFEGAVTVTDLDRVRVEPALAFRAVVCALERDTKILPHLRDTIMTLTSDVAFCEALRKDPDARVLFRDVVATKRQGNLNRGSALRELHELGLLVAMVPEFSPVVGRVHHDTYHVYTVDVHSVAAVDRLAALARGEFSVEYPLASRLGAEVIDYPMLSFATLLHDVGKAIGGKDHSVRGADMSREILDRLGFSPSSIEDAARLIFAHLSMYRLATRRDVDDPATIDEMLGVVRNREELRNLFLLTVADVSTTSPTSMTSWKSHMLEELYLATDEKLGGAHGEVDRRRTAVDAILHRATVEPKTIDFDSRLAFLNEYVGSMPDRYLLSAKPQAVLLHAEISRRKGERRVSVGLVPSRHPDTSELCIVADDRPGLLSLIAAALSSSRLEIHAAQIHTRTTPRGIEAVDLFWVRDRHEAGIERMLVKLSSDIDGLLQGKLDPGAFIRGGLARKKGPKVKTRISIDQRASPLHTVVEVTTEDRQGILFAIAHAMYSVGLTIEVAKINTEGARVADVFYVSEQSGAKVSAGSRTLEVEAALYRALDAPMDEVREAIR